MSRTVVLATGGTGGHIYPALALAGRLAAHDVRSVLIGVAGGLEERLSAEAGVEFRGVSSGKIDRQRPDPRELARAFRGVVQARRLLRELRPQLVIGFGGFASLPASAAAAQSGVPLWLNEQNSFPGLVTRLLSRRAELVIASVATALPRIRARNSTVIPYPVDETRFSRTEARARLGLPADGLLTLVMGGSQGSVALNEAVLNVLHQNGQPVPLTLHLSGPANLEAVLTRQADPARHHVLGYADGRLAFAAADLAITRAGIGTLSMAAFNGVPLIMVPLPTSAENHQYHNARTFEEAGAGVLLPQSGLDRLADVWPELLADGPRRKAAGAAMSELSPAGALTRFSRLVTDRLEAGRP